jgi:hypothetical protein
MAADPLSTKDDLWRTLQAVSEWIRVADAKAGATLAVDGVLLALLAGRLRGTPTPPLPAAVGLSLALIAAAVSGLLAIWTVVPRMKRLGANSMIHYGAIAAFDSAASYHKAAISLADDPDGVPLALTQQIWTISRSAKRKYHLVTWAIRLLVASLFAGALSLIWW